MRVTLTNPQKTLVSLFVPSPPSSPLSPPSPFPRSHRHADARTHHVGLFVQEADAVEEEDGLNDICNARAHRQEAPGPSRQDPSLE